MRIICVLPSLTNFFQVYSSIGSSSFHLRIYYQVSDMFDVVYCVISHSRLRQSNIIALT